MDALKRSVKGGSPDDEEPAKPKKASGGARKTARKTKSAPKSASKSKSAKKAAGRRKAA